jgi:RNA polymerase sigma-70 factor (ECF subfamily)
MRERDLGALYGRLEKPVYNVLYRWVWSREEARDLLQETFLRLWKMRRKVVLETVEPLVYRIALNLARSRLRRRRILGWVPLERVAGLLSDGSSLERDLERSEAESRLRAAVLELPEELRQVILLCEFTGMTYEQIGEALSIPAGTVGSRRNRALKHLKVQLERR